MIIKEIKKKIIPTIKTSLYLPFYSDKIAEGAIAKIPKISAGK